MGDEGDTFKAIDRLNIEIPESDLETARSLILQSDYAKFRWAYELLLLRKSAFDYASEVMVREFLENENKQADDFWRLYRKYFAGKKDYDSVLQRLKEALLAQFENGTSEQKHSVVRIFGLHGINRTITIDELKNVMLPPRN